jgi:hypothetical protein
MDEHDRANLDFLLNADPAVLLDWYEQMDEDDHIYAMALLEVARVELLDQIVITRDDCVDAQRLLKNIFQ